MCTPLAVAALALAGAGTGLQMSAASESRKAMNAAQSAELARQKQHSERAKAFFQETLAGATPKKSGQDLAVGEQRRERAYQAVEEIAPGASALPADTSGPRVVAEQAARGAEDRARHRQASTALANLNAYQDRSLAQALRLNQGAENQAVLGDIRRGSLAVLPIEMEAAQQKGQNQAMAGQLLSALGSIAGTGAAVAGGPSWASILGNGAKPAATVPITFSF